VKISDLYQRRGWVLWKKSGNNKVPYRTNKKLASTTNPTNWSTHEECISHLNEFDGIGMVLTKKLGITVIDIDKTTEHRLIEAMNSYTELSPSKNGLHILIQGTLPHGCRHRHAGFEVYDDKMFITITEDIVNGRNIIEKRQNELNKLLMTNTRTTSHQSTTRNQRESDDNVLKKAMNAVNGDKFRKLWKGDASDYQGDESRADIALARFLWFWTGKDRNQVKRLMEKSSLCRSKWDEKRGNGTYLDYTIDKVFST
jgi:putative DNA primase/helicase